MPTQTVKVSDELRHRDTCRRATHDPGDLTTCYERVEAFVDIEVQQPVREPDADGFLLAALKRLGLLRGNAILAQWPACTEALRIGDWGLARRVVDLAHQLATVSDAERDALVMLFEAHHIPKE